MTADEFNALYQVGTKVRYRPLLNSDDGIITRTRSEAWELGNGTPVVSIEGKAGGVSLDALTIL